jgi:uncharacterized protein
VWLWVLPFLVLFYIEELLPGINGPLPRDFGRFLDSDRAEVFFRGAWGWFAVIVVLAVFNTVLGEELLFRGLLLPRMRGFLEGATLSPMGCCSRSTTCTSLG